MTDPARREDKREAEVKGIPIKDLPKEQQEALRIFEPGMQEIEVPIGDTAYPLTRKTLEEQTDWTFLEGATNSSTIALKLLSHISGLSGDEVVKRVGSLNLVGILFVKIVNQIRDEVTEDIRGRRDGR